MTKEELICLLNNQEDNFVERKLEGVKNAEIRRTVVAFANTIPEGRTGVLFIGVNDAGVLIGVKNSDSLQKTIRNICENECYPTVHFSTEVLSINDLNILAVLIQESQNKPHFSGQAFVRQGSESVSASKKVFDELIYSRNSKCAAMLKFKNQVITVQNLEKSEYISTKPNSSECRVDAVDAHTVRLHILASDRMETVPIENVKISRDEQKYRPMLIVFTNK